MFFDGVENLGDSLFLVDDGLEDRDVPAGFSLEIGVDVELLEDS